MRALASFLLFLALAALTAAPPSGAELAYDLQARSLRGLPSSMAALILSGGDGGEVLFAPLALALGPAEGEPEGGSAPEGGPRRLVALLLEVDGASLLGEASTAKAALEVYAYALTPRGEVAGFLSQTVPLDLDALGEAISMGGLKLLTHLDLPAGRYELRVLVHEPGSGRFGLVALPLEVPHGAGALSPPVVAEPEAPWLLVAEPPRPGGRSVDFAARLARVGLPLPSTLPVLGGDAAELDALLYLPPGAVPPGAVRARLRKVVDGSRVEAPVAVLSDSATGVGGLRRLRLRMPLKMGAGSYFLRLAARGRDREIESPEIGVVVRGASASGFPVWTDVQRRIRGEPPRAELEIGTARRAKARTAQLTRATSAAYRTVLRRLASGDRDAAVEDLLRIEEQALGRAEGRPPLLLEAETAVVESVAAADPEALVPVANLHLLAHHRSWAAHRFDLAAHARAMAAAVAERYASAGGDGAAEIAAEVLAAVGDDLERAGVVHAARERLEKALQLDPRNGFVLLRLAASYERDGEYGRAADLLEDLVAADPKAPAARLRLAVNLLRLGKRQRGLAVLGRLIREHNPDWVLVVAYEELAKDRLRSGDPDGAVTVLRRGLARLPDQGRLAIQLAYTLDRAGRRRDAVAALERLSVSAGSEASPRHLYSVWPAGGREELDASLARAALLRLGALGHALPPGGGREGRR